MEVKDYSISGLYYRYGKTSDSEIRRFLDTKKLVRCENIDNESKYFQLSKTSVDRIYDKLRKVTFSSAFDESKTDNEAISGLKEFLKITYLVKSSSRFFIKQDIGEVLDQLGWEYMLDEKIKAICLNDEYEPLPDTDGEHFLMTVTLLIEE